MRAIWSLDGIVGLAVSKGLIAVGLSSSDMDTEDIFLIDVASDRLIRTLERSCKVDGVLGKCAGLRFSHDGHGDQLLVADSMHKRLTLFTLTFACLRHVGVGLLTSPVDVAFATNGDLLVLDAEA